MPASKLIRPSIEYKTSFLQACEEYRKEGRKLCCPYDNITANFDEIIEELHKDKGHRHREYPDWVEVVPETILWLVKDEDYIGTIVLRHRLNWHLEKWGGHVGFIVRPSKRGMGYGRKIVNKALPYASTLGLDQVLVTLSPDNSAAIHVVESLGGEFDDELHGTDRFPPVRRYWLDCG